MRRELFLSLSFALFLMLAACAPSTPAEPARTEAVSTPADTPTSTVAAPTSAGTQASPAAGAATEVDVTLEDNTIQSSLTTFKAGVPYRIVITNNGQHQHNFNISTPVEQAGSMDAALAGALLTLTEDQLPLGGGTTVEYVFPTSAVGQSLEFSCLIRRHYHDGMRLVITVTQ